MTHNSEIISVRETGRRQTSLSPGRRTNGQGVPQDAAGSDRRLAETPGLVATGLSKSYGSRPVVKDVSLSVGRGEAVGLLGPNGAGKTTVFYMITGLIVADRGTISFMPTASRCSTRH